MSARVTLPPTVTRDIASGLPTVVDDGNQYVYGAAGLNAMKQGGSWYYYLADGLGSTMAIVNPSGVVQNSYTYDVYGEASVTGTLANEFDFAGQQTDSTGLQYLRARYMDPETGTFLSRDPLASDPTWPDPSFTYASSSPANMTDPTGLTSIGREPQGSGSIFLGPCGSGGRGGKGDKGPGPICGNDIPHSGLGGAGRGIADGILKYLKFTAKNFRKNLQRLTGEYGAGMHAHHVLPKQFEALFSRAGLNIMIQNVEHGFLRRFINGCTLLRSTTTDGLSSSVRIRMHPPMLF